MRNSSELYPNNVDISNCDKEPIHIIGKSQSHGLILSVYFESLEVIQSGSNAKDILGISSDNILGRPVQEIVGDSFAEKLAEKLQQQTSLLPEELEINGKKFIVLAHRSEENLILDIEPLGELHDPYLFQRQLTKVLNNLKVQENAPELCREVARLTREFFDYDRVMIYRFDEEWNGEVIAEEKKEELESWLGLHYPASDIPAQSRKLFLKHPIRIIADVNYDPVSISPELSPVTGKPLDLSRSQLRGVSPIHIEYLQNMNVGASLTAAIIVNGKLWGLIACHHYSAKFINYYERESYRFLTEMFSSELSLIETNKFLKKTDKTNKLRNELIVKMKEANTIPDALIEASPVFTELLSCSGGAIIWEEETIMIGKKVPAKASIKKLVEELIRKQEEDMFFTKNLGSFIKLDESVSKLISGLLSIRVTENKYLVWFRPELVQVVDWGGNPEKKVTYNEAKKRLSPRKSFEKWSQKLTGISESWKGYELSAAKGLREDISHIIVEKQRNEIHELNERLLDANKELELFGYGMSHDMKAPLRGIKGYAEILQEDYASNLNKEGQYLINTILGLTGRLENLIDDILSFSKMNSRELRAQKISVNTIISEIIELFNVKVNYPRTEIMVEEDMPFIKGDKKMIFQIWSNLMNNALKYSAKIEAPQIKIGSEKVNGKNVFFIADNGIGIASEYHDKIFESFSRLAGDGYKGTGIGLAIVKRIIEKHEGEIWVESEPGKGAKFNFYLN
ncbi:ATP-binding protein [Salegentibacter chungangensis]|uniref:histidine kinase n=1 Tax=Salegentibacter chungangensis TaxID=1335724 RepID=A0ABW3NR04_9FLAO